MSGKSPRHLLGRIPFRGKDVGVALALSVAAASAGTVEGIPGPLLAWGLAAGGMGIGLWVGWKRQTAAAQKRFYRVADELVQYRAFTGLLRSQSERIIGLSEEAAVAIVGSLHEIDERAAALVQRLNAAAASEIDDETRKRLLRDAAAITEPGIAILGKLQFQDVTQQQLTFLSRLSLIMDEHIENLIRGLGDRRSLDRTAHFKELFEQARDQTVMVSQRNDHHAAAGTEFIESSGPPVQMFTDSREVP